MSLPQGQAGIQMDPPGRGAFSEKVWGVQSIQEHDAERG